MNDSTLYARPVLRGYIEPELGALGAFFPPNLRSTNPEGLRLSEDDLWWKYYACVTIKCLERTGIVKLFQPANMGYST
jgi:hypothetical protein